MMNIPFVFDIKRGSMDDGDGIRTVIFFKGCPLNCSWCHNPESKKEESEYFYHKDKCINCGKCMDKCPTGAWQLVGKRYKIKELLSIILEDKTFYHVSGGGVTLSGGEPTLYMEFIGTLLEELDKMGISCALQTCGYFDFNRFKKYVLPYLDCIMFDIKLMDCDEHRKHTGVENDIILNNLKLLKKEKVRIIPRTPLIPDITDTVDNLIKIKSFLSELRLENEYIKLPYNNSGLLKRKMLKRKE